MTYPCAKTWQQFVSKRNIKARGQSKRGLETATSWLAVDGLLAQFAKQRRLVQQRYAQFIAEGRIKASPWPEIKSQVFLGDEQFVQRMQVRSPASKDDAQIPLAQRRPLPPPLEQIERDAKDRNSAILTAYATGAYSYQDIAEYFRIHFTSVGRVVRGGK